MTGPSEASPPEQPQQRWSRKKKVLTFLGLIGLPLFIGCSVALTQAVWNAQEAAARASCHLGQIHLAFHNYYDTYNEFPPRVVHDASGKPLYSWRVLLLPFMDSKSLYEKFHLDESWDSEHNSQFIDQMPSIYGVPWRKVFDPPPGNTMIRVIYGPGTLFEGSIDIWNDCPDGAKNTLLFVEAGEPDIWTKPHDFEYHPDRPVEFRGAFKTVTRAATLAKGHNSLPNELSQEILHALITRNGGETIPHPWNERQIREAKTSPEQPTSEVQAESGSTTTDQPAQAD